ncbi:hypothetical protein ACNKHQ_13300 [Shigella flexneri]
MEVIREELELVREQFGDARRTEITANSADINIRRSDRQEDVVVTLFYTRVTLKYSAAYRLRSSASW